MGVFERIGRIIRSNISDLLDRAEDPEKLLEQIVSDMRQDLREAKLHVAAAIRDQKKLGDKYRLNLELARKYEEKAMRAVQADNDLLAKEALKKKKIYDDLAKSYKEQFDEQSESVQQLRTSLAALETKIEDARRRKDLLIARQKRATAQRAITETMNGMSRSNALAALERMEGRVKAAEIHAEALAEVEANSLENKFVQLGNEAIDDELERLKIKLSQKKEDGE